MFRKILVLLFSLALFVVPVFAQPQPYLQVNSGADVRVSSGQSVYIVLQMGNPTTQPLENVQVECTIETTTGTISVDEENTAAYILENVTVAENIVTFGEGAEMEFSLGQFGNVQLVLTVEAEDETEAEGTVTCQFSADGEMLGEAVEVNIASTNTANDVADETTEQSDDESETDTSEMIRINNGDEIRVSDGESIELVIQVGNTSDDILNNVEVVCVVSSTVGRVTILDERTNPRDFISYSWEDDTVVFGRDEDVTLPVGQNTTIALGIQVDTDGEDSADANVNCELFAETESIADDDTRTLTHEQDDMMSDDDDMSDDTEDTSEQSSQTNNSSGSLSINNGDQLSINSGQSAELVIQFGNTSSEPMVAPAVVCSISSTSGTLSAVDERTNAYNFGTYSIGSNVVTFSGDDLPAGQNMNVALGILVDGDNTEGTVNCILTSSGIAQASDSIAISAMN